MTAEPTNDETPAFHAFLDRYAAFVHASKREHGDVNVAGWQGRVVPGFGANLDSGHLLVAATLFDAYVRCEALAASQVVAERGLAQAVERHAAWKEDLVRGHGRQVEPHDVVVAGIAELAPGATFLPGMKVRARRDVLDGHGVGVVIAPEVMVATQLWTPLVWPEHDEDPTWFKSSHLERA